MRESSGVYEFGTRRIMVKVERDRILIKVGGGFLSIDEFLDHYTPEELAKIERKDPFKRLSEKVAIQKTIGDRSGLETSPVRRSLSPLKQAPIRSSLPASPVRRAESPTKQALRKSFAKQIQAASSPVR